MTTQAAPKPNAFGNPSGARFAERLLAEMMAKAAKAERRPHAATRIPPPQDKTQLRVVQRCTLRVLDDEGALRFSDLLNAIELPSGKVPSGGNLSTVLRELQALGFSEVFQAGKDETDGRGQPVKQGSNIHRITEAGRAALAEQAPADADA
jgi:DNA-binding PadR family transcriptional regulator